jgi:hypothetical protein
MKGKNFFSPLRIEYYMLCKMRHTSVVETANSEHRRYFVRRSGRP